MTRIDMTTSEWHQLVKPVLPHASTDAEVPELNVLRFEGRDRIIYAVATDRYTLGACRHVFDAPIGDEFIVCISRMDAAAMLRLFAYTKDSDPQLRITVDTVIVPHNGHELRDLGLTIESEEGTRLILRNCHGALSTWRKQLGQVLHRDLAPAADRLLLMPGQLARWAAAAHYKGERITVLAGPEIGSPILILVEDHFAGVWMPAGHIDGDSDDLLYASPWRAELADYAS